jgi:hypothetical protein
MIEKSISQNEMPITEEELFHNIQHDEINELNQEI